jgi:transposase-like protein
MDSLPYLYSLRVTTQRTALVLAGAALIQAGSARALMWEWSFDAPDSPPYGAVAATGRLLTGITPDGKRSILGCSVELSEAEHHWRKFLQSLLDRGMHGMKLVVSDDHAGLKAARQAVMPGVPWQRCQFHTIQNAMAHVPKVAMRVDVARDIKRIFNADDAAEADRRLKDTVTRYQKSAPGLAGWLEANVPEAITVFGFPPGHRRRLRTNNGLERLNKEIKRRTRVATLFPNEASLLRLVSAVLSEISDDWETERSYLNMEAR